ncbi:MAG: HD domain-containing protein, partial [Gemmatimonadetes bacterium]|nr:HD domain-containing protein [Gemmatimonadota bacterium]
AALLHDIGHYAFSHAIEELEPERTPGDHEAVAERFFRSEALALALAPLGEDAPGRIFDLIRGRSDAPLAGLVSGSLDLDKMEYLRRDARFCGVPYGEVDVDRLLQGLLVLPAPESGRLEIGVDEKALSALESLLFAKYQMFRNVYWHHAVRSATALYKRIVESAVEAEWLGPDELVGPTDEELLFRIAERARARGAGGPLARRVTERWLPALRERRLPKRAVEIPAADMDGGERIPELAGDLSARRGVEDEWAVELGLEPGEVFIDFPVKPAMFQSNALVRRSGGTVVRIGSGGIRGLIDLPALAEALYRSARVLRVFTLERRTLDPARVLERLSRR